MKNKFLILLFVVLAVLTACKKENTVNVPPTAEITLEKDSVLTGDTINITVSASDPENAGLIYTWTVTGGTVISGNNTAAITWKAPDKTGEITVTVNVSDKENDVQANQKIKVFNLMPVVTITADRDTVYIEEAVTLTATATDPDNDKLTYQWILPGGTTISGSTSSPTLTWRTPNQAGAKTITLRINDGVNQVDVTKTIYNKSCVFYDQFDNSGKPWTLYNATSLLQNSRVTLRKKSDDYAHASFTYLFAPGFSPGFEVKYTFGFENTLPLDTALEFYFRFNVDTTINSVQITSIAFSIIPNCSFNKTSNWYVTVYGYNTVTKTGQWYSIDANSHGKNEKLFLEKNKSYTIKMRLEEDKTVRFYFDGEEIYSGTGIQLYEIPKITATQVLFYSKNQVIYLDNCYLYRTGTN